MTTRRFRGSHPVTEATYAVFSEPEVAAIGELARCAGWRDDPEWIGRALVPPVSSDIAEAALSTLEAVGSLVRDSNGHLVVGRDNWATQHDVLPPIVALALYKLNRVLLARAAMALEGIPPEERQFGNITCAVPASAVRRCSPSWSAARVLATGCTCCVLSCSRSRRRDAQSISITRYGSSP
jgi:hypothetical protein